MLIKFEENFHYSEKQEYINLVKDFLEDKIMADDFSYSFLGIYEGISKKVNQMKKEELVELANFLKPNRPELGDLLCRTYGTCDSFSLDPELNMSSETELKSFARTLLSIFESELPILQDE